jgi:hypothetical protein
MPEEPEVKAEEVDECFRGSEVDEDDDEEVLLLQAPAGSGAVPASRAGTEVRWMGARSCVCTRASAHT